jgi:hypothetical protein
MFPRHPGPERFRALEFAGAIVQVRDERLHVVRVDLASILHVLVHLGKRRLQAFVCLLHALAKERLEGRGYARGK